MDAVTLDAITLDMLVQRGQGLSVAEVALSTITSFTLSSVVAWAYAHTYRGFSYSRSFVHALILGAICTTIMIAAIGNNIALGLGVIGALAIIRFRTQIRDPRDMMFLFAALTIGTASGARVYEVAFVGTAVFLGIVGYLHWAPMASLHTYEGLVRFMADAQSCDIAAVERRLEECCTKVKLTSVREAFQGEGLEYSYQVRLRDISYQNQVTQRLNAIAGVEDASLMMHRSTVEI